MVKYRGTLQNTIECFCYFTKYLISKSRNLKNHLTCANYCMKLINEKNYLPIWFWNSFQHCFESIFELSTIFCSSNECTHIKWYQLRLTDTVSNINYNKPCLSHFKLWPSKEWQTFRFAIASGTSPCTMRCAKLTNRCRSTLLVTFILMMDSV